MANASIRSHAGTRICSLPPDRFRLGGLVLIFVLPPSAPRPFRPPPSPLSHLRTCSRRSPHPPPPPAQFPAGRACSDFRPPPSPPAPFSSARLPFFPHPHLPPPV